MQKKVSRSQRKKRSQKTYTKKKSSEVQEEMKQKIFEQCHFKISNHFDKIRLTNPKREK